MRPSFESSSYEALLVEQAEVQAEKFQGRTLTHYSQLIFPTQHLPKPRGSAVVDFVEPIIGKVGQVTLGVLLEGLSEAKNGQSIHWVDMGGGRALPMRQLGAKANIKSKIAMTNVDLFNYNLNGLEPDELEYLESIAPGMTDKSAEPEFISHNIETVALKSQADIITAIETMQYLNDPIGALANWYNQLADNGIVFIAAQHEWPDWVRFKETNPDNDESPIKLLLEELTRTSVNYAITNEADWPNGLRPIAKPDNFRIMALQKKPGTVMRVNMPPQEVWSNNLGYKAVYYGSSLEASRPIVEVDVSIDKKLGLKAVDSLHTLSL